MRTPSFVASGVVVCVALAMALSGVFGAALAEGKGKALGVPKVMSYEGYITDENGEPLADGLYDFIFAIYGDQTGGSPLWVEEHRSVKVHRGVVRVRLGAGSVPTSLDLPFDRQYYLGIKIGEDPEMTPRLQFMTSAYTFRAKMADEVPDASITTNKLAPGSVTDDKIESVSWSKITGVPGTNAAAAAEAPGSKPKPSNQWHTDGNIKTNPDLDYVGTGDATDLVFKTDAKEAMRIDRFGAITMENSLTVKDYIYSVKSKRVGGFMLADSLHGLKRLGDNNVRLFTTAGHVLLEGGNVGIGTDSPAGRLHVYDGKLIVNGSNGKIAVGTTSPAGKLRVYGGSLIVDGTGAKAGIGTSSPEATLHVVSPGSEDGGKPSGYPVYVDGDEHGIAISVRKHNGAGGLSPNGNNSFVSFWNNTDNKLGEIKGMDLVDWATDWQHWTAIAYDLIEVAYAAADLGGALAGAHVCAGAGAVACPPSPGDIAASIVKVAIAASHPIVTQVQHSLKLVPYGGVSYSSGLGDYAEWLSRLDEEEIIEPGDIVGVFGGKVTKETSGAQQFMVVSEAPIVLGNMPSKDTEHLCEKVAFLGQVTVKVIGPVREGDYIIPSGQKDGTGVAVSPELMTADEYAKAVGRSWGASDSQAMKYVNIAVGVNQGDVAAYVARQQIEVQTLMQKLASRDEAVRKTQEGLDELRSSVEEMGDLHEEIAELKAAVRTLQGFAAAGNENGRVVPASLNAAGR